MSKSNSFPSIGYSYSSPLEAVETIKPNGYVYRRGRYHVVFNGVCGKMVLPHDARHEIEDKRDYLKSLKTQENVAIILHDLRHRPFKPVYIDARKLQAHSPEDIDFDHIGAIVRPNNHTDFVQRIIIVEGGGISGLGQIELFKDALGCEKVRGLWGTLPNREDFEIDNRNENVIAKYSEVASPGNSQDHHLRSLWCTCLEDFNHSKAMVHMLHAQLKTSYMLGHEVSENVLCFSELVYQLFEENLVEAAKLTLALHAIPKLQLATLPVKKQLDSFLSRALGLAEG